MNLFDFLKRLDRENIEFKSRYDCSSWISITIPMNDHSWSVNFDESGFLGIDVFKVTYEHMDENPEQLFALFNGANKVCTNFAKEEKLLFKSPFTFVGQGGTIYEVEGIFPEFGSKNGVVVTSNKDSEEDILQLEYLSGYNVIYLSINHGVITNPDSLKEMLSEFDWKGKGTKPDWINGN